MLPPGISQHFIPLRGSPEPGQELIYHPALLAAGRVQFADRKTKVSLSEELVTLAPLTEGTALAVDWDDVIEVDLDVADLEAEPEAEARYAPLPAPAAQKKSYTAWKKEYADWFYRNRQLELFMSPGLGEVSQPGESEREFRIRLSQSAREARDEALERLRKKYAPKLSTLQERIRRAEQAVEREAEQAKQQKLQTAISFGATLLSAVVGRKTVSRSSLGRATTAARGVSRSMKEAQDIERARETLVAHQQKLADLEAEFEAETEEIKQRLDPQEAELESVVVRPKKKDISVKLVALGWAPHWQAAGGEAIPAWE